MKILAMRYNNKWVTDHLETNEQLKFLFFWGHQPLKNGKVGKSCFSQWFEISFTNDSILYLTAEHYMMAEKARLFNDDEILEQILKSTSAGEVKMLGRKIKNFDASVWDTNKYKIVVKGNYLKFKQNKSLNDFLLNTKKRILVEASPYDSIWGIGMSEKDKYISNPKEWKGLNLLGYAIMEVRDLLIKEQN